MAGTSPFDNRLFFIGEVIQHFKRNTMTEEELKKFPRRHIYTITGTYYNVERESAEVSFQCMETGLNYTMSMDAFCGYDPQGSGQYLFDKFPM